jgi:hypothetical protein
MSLLSQFKGAAAYLNQCQGISIEAAEEDQDEEVESLLNSFDVDDQAASGTLRCISTNDSDAAAGSVPPSKHRKVSTSRSLVDHCQLSSSLEAASAGVVVDTTLSDYQRYT